MKILYFFLFSFLFIACNTPVINKNDVVAEVNGEQILLSELASQSKQEIFDILNTAYEIKSRVLAGLIKQKLLEAMNQYILGELYLFRRRLPHNVLWFVVNQEGVWQWSALFILLR